MVMPKMDLENLLRMNFLKSTFLTCEATVGQVENFVKKKPAMCLDLVAVHQLQ